MAVGVKGVLTLVGVGLMSRGGEAFREVDEAMRGRSVREMVDYLDTVPEDVLEDVLRYEEEFLKREFQGTRGKRRFPSNQDIAEAIVQVTGGVLYEAGLPDLYELVKKRLEEEGFDTSFVGERRVIRILNSLVKKGVIKMI